MFGNGKAQYFGYHINFMNQEDMKTMFPKIQKMLLRLQRKMNYSGDLPSR